jgi:DNA-binding NarL/FixJ family response regulator
MTQRSRTTPDRLTLMPEELAVAHLVADGLSNRDVAHRLVVSQKTVKSRLRNVYVKLRLPKVRLAGNRQTA